MCALTTEKLAALNELRDLNSDKLEANSIIRSLTEIG